MMSSKSGEVSPVVSTLPAESAVERVTVGLRIEREWAMPNQWTFTIRPITRLLSEEVSSSENWADPFAGMNSPAGITNDLRGNMPTLFHKDALEFLKELQSDSLDGVLFDPPYSITQAKQCYEGFGMDKLDTKPTSMKYWGDCKNEIARVVKVGGKVICFGWNSMGIGKNRGFEMNRILLVPHGGSKNDTICTVETRLTAKESSPPSANGEQTPTVS